MRSRPGSRRLGRSRLIAFREAGNEGRFFDIHFVPVQRDPIGVIQQLYDFLGEPLTAEARARMEKWRAETPREMHGEHHYDPNRDFRKLPPSQQKEYWDWRHSNH